MCWASRCHEVYRTDGPQYLFKIDRREESVHARRTFSMEMWFKLLFTGSVVDAGGRILLYAVLSAVLISTKKPALLVETIHERCNNGFNLKVGIGIWMLTTISHSVIFHYKLLSKYTCFLELTCFFISFNIGSKWYTQFQSFFIILDVLQNI